MNNINGDGSAKILITGASGLSGSIIIREFARQNIPVRALVRTRAKANELVKYSNVEIFEGDLLQPETLAEALSGVQKALLISSAFDRMVDTQKSFIDAAKKSGVPHVIKYSGAESGIGFNSQNFIAQREHENLEDYLVHSGLKWTLLRPCQFMQMYLPGAPTGVSLKDNALVLPIENARQSPVDIEDVAKVCIDVLTGQGHEGKIYEMTGPDSVNMKEACDIISRATGRKISYTNIMLEDYLDSLQEHGFTQHRIQILREISQERMKCTESHIKLDTHKRFGVRPTNFAEFIYKNSKAFAE